VVDLAIIAVLVKEIPAPLNVLAGPGTPPVVRLGELGVARVSVGSKLALAAYDLARRATRELLAGGGYPEPAGGLNHAELNQVLSRATA
jgi:2-methylisocitrate lyase-like PEP mutase family enzyme